MTLFIPIYFPKNKTLKSSNSKKFFLEKKFCSYLQIDMVSWPNKNSDLKKLDRFDSDSTVEEIVVKFQIIKNSKSFFDLCYLNRDCINYCLLYRLSAVKLRTEADPKLIIQTRKVEEFREKILKNIIYIDQPVTQGLILAEKRIKQIFQGSFDDLAILEQIGNNSTEVSFFWVVLYAALNAWEKKEKTEPNQANSESYYKLKKIKEIFSKSNKHQKMLVCELKFLEFNFGEEKNLNEFFEYEMDLVEGLKLLISNLEKLPPNSYRPLLEKILLVCNRILEKKIGFVIENFNNFKISFPLYTAKSSSRLIEIQKNENI